MDNPKEDKVMDVLIEKAFRSCFLVFFAVTLAACGSSSSSSDDAAVEMMVDVNIASEALTGGVPKTFTYTLPEPETPLTDFTIDLEQSLEAATITVTPN